MKNVSIYNPLRNKGELIITDEKINIYQGRWVENDGTSHPLKIKRKYCFNKKYVYYLYGDKDIDRGKHISLNYLQNQKFLITMGHHWLQQEKNIRYLINIVFLILGLFSFNSCTPEQVVEPIICDFPSACNYGEVGECVYPEPYYLCNGGCSNDNNWNGICDEIEESQCVPVVYNGHTYNVVWVDLKCWFAENLKTFTTNNGDEIPINLSQNQWHNTETPAISIYEENTDGISDEEVLSNYNNYGVIYNGYASQLNVCPVGWRVAKKYDWDGLIESVSNTDELVSSPQDSVPWFGTNTTGFSIVEGGTRNSYIPPTDNYGENHTSFWAPTGGAIWSAGISENSQLSVSYSGGFWGWMTWGRYIRCVKN